MTATYNGITGELVRLERKWNPMHGIYLYDLDIYDKEKQATISFQNVKLTDVKFSGGEVRFDG